jgi:hypothetical protein
MIDGLVYRVHRAPRLRLAMLDEHARTSWVLHSATYVEPVTNGVEVSTLAMIGANRVSWSQRTTDRSTCSGSTSQPQRRRRLVRPDRS